MNSSAFYILLVLASADRHGLAISSEVESITSGEVRLVPGVLYRHLKQMETDGWIAEVKPRGDPGGVRRYYRLTPRGRSVVRAEAQRLQSAVRIAKANRLLPGTP